jgi:hypothetical protein
VRIDVIASRIVTAIG